LSSPIRFLWLAWVISCGHIPLTQATEMSSSRLTTSIILGTTLGFGSGHAIQGRYSERGWLTIAELSALYVAGAGFLECENGMGYLFGRNPGSTPVNQNGCSLIKVGSLVFLGLRIFEFWDLIRFLPTTRRDSPLKIIPEPSVGGVSVSFVY
jgi:hypothetical protein